MAIIQLPGSGQVQSLGRVSPQQKAAAAAQPSQLRGSIAQDISKLADYSQSLIDQKESAIAGNKAIAASGLYERLTSQEFVSAKDLPAEVLGQMIDSPQAEVNNMGETTYPQDAVGPALSKYFASQVKNQEQAITNNRSRAMYERFVGETVRKNQAKGQSNVVMAQIAASKREFDKHVDADMVAGDIPAALETIKLANVSGFYSEREADKQRNTVFKRAGEQLDQALNNEQVAYVNAIADDNIQAMGDAKGKAEKLISDALKYGDKIIPKEEAAERIRKLDVAGDAMYMQKHIIDIFNGPKGFIGAQSAMIELRTNPKHRPDNTTQKEWDSQLKAIDSMLNVLQGDKDRVAKKALEFQTERAGQQQLSYLVAKGQTLNGHKEAMKVADTQFQLGMNNLVDAPPMLRLNFIRDFVAQTKYIPKTLNNQLSNMISSENTDTLVEAAQIYTVLRTDETTSMMAGDINTTHQSLLTDISNATRLYSQEDVPARIETLLARYKDVDKVKSEIYLAQNSKALEIKTLYKDFTESMGDTDMYGTGWFGGANPKATSEAFITFDAIVNDQIKSGASYDAAKATANAHIKNSFAITDSDPAYPEGKMMRNPPEMLGTWPGPQWDADKKRLYSSYADEFGAENIYLEATGITTQREEGTGQRYKVMVRTSKNDEFTARQALYENGAKAYWSPNYASTPEAKQQIEEADLENSSIEATKQIVDFARTQMSEAIRETVDKTPQVRANMNMTVFDATEEIFDQAIKDLKNNPSMYDEKLVGGRVKNLRPVLNTDRYNRALKQLKLARNQATETVGREQDIGPYLPPSARRTNKPLELEEPKKKVDRRGRGVNF